MFSIFQTLDVYGAFYCKVDIRLESHVTVAIVFLLDIYTNLDDN